MKHIEDKTVKCIIGFGDWSLQRDSVIRGHRRVPVQEFKKQLRKWCKTVDVDEFRTSKLCCYCHSETEKVSYGGVKINSVLRCMNNECGKIVDRDINGANNISSLFHNMIQGKERPEAFRRLLVADEKRSNRESVVKPLAGYIHSVSK